MCLRARRVRVGAHGLGDTGCIQALTTLTDDFVSPGCYRCEDVGEDALKFYGSATAPENMPRLQLVISGAEPVVNVPTQMLRLGDRGRIVAGSTSSIEISCDGGPGGVFDGYGRPRVLASTCVCGFCDARLHT